MKEVEIRKDHARDSKGLLAAKDALGYIAGLRRFYDVSLTKASEVIDVSHTQLGRYESGYSAMTVEQLQKLADHINCELTVTIKTSGMEFTCPLYSAHKVKQ